MAQNMLHWPQRTWIWFQVGSIWDQIKKLVPILYLTLKQPVKDPYNSNITCYCKGISFRGFKISWIAIPIFFHGFIFSRVYTCDPNIFVRSSLRPCFSDSRVPCVQRDTVRDRYFLVYEKWGMHSILLPFLSWETMI